VKTDSRKKYLSGGHPAEDNREGRKGRKRGGNLGVLDCKVTSLKFEKKANSRLFGVKEARKEKTSKGGVEGGHVSAPE